MSHPADHEGTIPLPNPANDDGGADKPRVKVLIPKDLPVTQVEIEVFALLLDDLAGLAANDTEEPPQ
ncbi:MAG: hypothetical protein KGR48_15250 [Alphaproteobacteria bacterium]|nr:hypothetical protein [Alphaproteobacteria bacterium]MDE2011998.1 hypothetical protein [Alphaproteobacteria bacterium]MDE3115424.1 hypothetical protein [Pseudomonadota bacterium]